MGCSASSDVDKSANVPSKRTEDSINETSITEKVLSNKHKSPSGNELITFPKKRIKESFLDQTKPTKGKADYTLNPTGIYEKFLDFRSNKVPPKTTKRPQPTRRLWVDPDFNPEIITNNNIEWVRPKDYCEKPRLFVGGFGRQDIQQGCIGDCYFLAFISGLAERPDLMSKVIPYDAYLVERPDYDGIFHCRFWHFGQWEDVYVDDFIPTIFQRESIASARSVEKNEMWVTLLEKAWAKFWGGYEEIETTGLIMDAHRCLTGGMSEMMLFQDKSKKPKPQEVFKRLENSFLRVNTTAAASVGEASDGKHGLEGDHAFSVIGTARAKLNNGEEAQLVCLRNPWGGTEWTGPWSVGSKEWNQVVSGVEKPNEDNDGELYISVNDFCKYFESCTICDLTPDINRDGTGEECEYLTSIYAEWKDDTAAGWDNVIQNTKTIFTISDDGADKEGFVPLGLSLVQQKHESEDDIVTICIQLYKVLGEKDGALVIEQILENHLKQIQVHDGARVKPGTYLVLALNDPPKEAHCLIRLFSMGPLCNIKLVPNNWDILTTPEKEKPLYLHDINCNLEYKEEVWGRWIRDINLGGQICETRFDINPQIELIVPETGGNKQALKFQLFKGRSSDEVVLGLRIFKLSSDEPMPKNTNWFWDKDQSNQTIKSTDGKIEGWEWNYIQPAYVLSPGRYCVVLYHSDENIESAFCLIIKSANQLQIKSYHLDNNEDYNKDISDDADAKQQDNDITDNNEDYSKDTSDGADATTSPKQQENDITDNQIDITQSES